MLLSWAGTKLQLVNFCINHINPSRLEDAFNNLLNLLFIRLSFYLEKLTKRRTSEKWYNFFLPLLVEISSMLVYHILSTLYRCIIDVTYKHFIIAVKFTSLSGNNVKIFRRCGKSSRDLLCTEHNKIHKENKEKKKTSKCTTIGELFSLN